MGGIAMTVFFFFFPIQRTGGHLQVFNGRLRPGGFATLRFSREGRKKGQVRKSMFSVQNMEELGRPSTRGDTPVPGL